MALSSSFILAIAVARILPVGGEGRWDYVTVDSANHRIFLPRVTHTQIVDAATGTVIADIPGQQHNHGTALAPAVHRGFITDGGDGSVTVFDLKTFAPLGKIKAQDDADGIVYDPASDHVFVACGDSSCVVPISVKVDPQHGSADTPIALGGKPEFLQSDGRGRLYVNLVDKDLVAVINTKTQTVVARWPVAPGGKPVGLAIDPSGEHLFVGCRQPNRLVMIRCRDGQVVGDMPIGKGVDATAFFDGKAFASCRDGTMAVATVDGDHLEPQRPVTTKPGARTMGVDTSNGNLYLATSEAGKFELLVVPSK